jgi:hypothetical protein
MPSPEARNSLYRRNPFTIKSRTISNDHRSPKTSKAMLTGHPDLFSLSDLAFPGTPTTLSGFTFLLQVFYRRKRAPNRPVFVEVPQQQMTQ